MNSPEKPEDSAVRLKRQGLRDISRAAARSVGYSRFVGLLRWFLPVLAMAGVALLFLWPKLRSGGIGEIAMQHVPNLVVEKLNLTGLDAQKQAYTVMAEKALQVAGRKNIVDLEKPRGELSLKDGSWFAGGAALGRYDQKTEKLWLGGAVEFFHDKGYRFAAEDVFVDLKKSLVWSDKNVVFQSDLGEIKGSGLRVLESGTVIVFKGPATARIRFRNEK